MAYIDERKLKAKLKYIFKVYGFSDFMKSKISKAIADSTADVVEVVRCKDCKNIKTMCDEKTLVCMRMQAYRDPTDFCSYGEKASTALANRKILCDECKRKDVCGKRPRTEEELEERKHDVCFQFEKEREQD